MNINAQEPLDELSNLFQTGIHILPSFRQICNTDSMNHIYPVGAELNESSERISSGIFFSYSNLSNSVLNKQNRVSKMEII